MTVECEIHDGGVVVCGRCRSTMAPEIGRPVGYPAWLHSWLWWRCETGHVTVAVPVPSEGVSPDRPTRRRPIPVL